MELTAWLSLVTICIFGAMTPGPSLVVVLKNTIGGGRSNGLVTALAQATGVAIYATLTVLGLAVLIQESPMVFNAIRYVSIVFILYLAYQAFTAKSGISKIDGEAGNVTLAQSAREGLMIAFVNPKLAIFFLALFSQFIQTDASWTQNAVMIATVGLVDFIWYTTIVLTLSQKGFLTALRNNIHIVEKITGVALLTVAARVAL
ncbi:MAG: LysE family translocator [Algicola sp.]|nr:LysE family translocator [Algicola sp.]